MIEVTTHNDAKIAVPHWSRALSCTICVSKVVCAFRTWVTSGLGVGTWIYEIIHALSLYKLEMDCTSLPVATPSKYLHFRVSRIRAFRQHELSHLLRDQPVQVLRSRLQCLAGSG